MFPEKKYEVIKILNMGMLLKGRYCILEQVGSGGEGHLYLARDVELGVLWAVKEIPRKKKSEAKLLRLLDHPALPRMIDYVEKEEFCYLVMEYIRGKSLAEWQRNGRCFSVQEMLKIGISISEVLNYLHGLTPPVFYGDLKPENLMLTEQNDLYLIDLGSAVFAYNGMGKSRVGTHGFAAPEQYQGEVRESSDVFGFGKTMLALASGTKKTEWIRNGEFLWILLRCSISNPAFRYKSMRDVSEKLENLYRGKKKVRFSVLWSVISAVVLSVLLMGILTGGQVPFEQEVGTAMKACYEQEFLDGTRRSEILKSTELKLRGLLKEYPGREEERKLLLMLALNEELQEEWEKSALCYEQLLLYDGEYRIGYGEYGCFLLRRGQKEEACRLWENYETENRKGNLDLEMGKNLREWMADIGKAGSKTGLYRKRMGFEAGGFEFWIGTDDMENDWQEEWSEQENVEQSEQETEDVEEWKEMEADPGNETEAEKPTTPSLEEPRTEKIEMEEKEEGKNISFPEQRNEEKQTPEKVDAVETVQAVREEVSEEKETEPVQKKEAAKASGQKKADQILKIMQKREQNAFRISEKASEEQAENSKFSEEQENSVFRQKKAEIEWKVGMFPFYYNRAGKKENSCRMQVKKYCLNIKSDTKPEISIKAEGPVHVWSVRSEEKEYMWHYRNGTLILDKEIEKDGLLELLLVYEEKMKAPVLTLT